MLRSGTLANPGFSSWKRESTARQISDDVYTLVQPVAANAWREDGTIVSSGIAPENRISAVSVRTTIARK